MNESRGLEILKKILIVCTGGVMIAAALNLFLIPANVYASGFSGVAQLISNSLMDYTTVHLSTGILLFILNIPVAILGWMKVGKEFTYYSFLSVLTASIFLEVIPLEALSQDILLNAVFGGVITAVGVGITLRVGASSGGLDIVAVVLSRMNGHSIGTYFFVLNGLIVITAGAIYGWEKALYTLVALYALTRVVDAIHTRHQRHTAMIITKKREELTHAIYEKMERGITVLPAKGAFSREESEMMMIVLTRYELYDLKRIIKEVDPDAFTNIVHTTETFGLFRGE